MNSKHLLAAAIAGVALGSNPSIEAAPKKQKKVECYGINSCSGTGKCVVTEDMIKEAKAAFPGKFGESIVTECVGNNNCGAPKHLAWIPKKNKKECLKAGGFLFKKEKDKYKIIKS